MDNFSDSQWRLNTSTRFELSISVKAVLSALEHAAVAAVAAAASVTWVLLDRVG